jgi:hypothetical protein
MIAPETLELLPPARSGSDQAIYQLVKLIILDRLDLVQRGLKEEEEGRKSFSAGCACGFL